MSQSFYSQPKSLPESVQADAARDAKGEAKMRFVNVPPPTSDDPDALTRSLHPSARAVLLEDTPNFWSEDQPALTNLCEAPILALSQFDELDENNKVIIVARVRHVLDELARRYVRHVGTEGPDVYQLRLGNVTVRDGEMIKEPRVFYLRDEALWKRLLELAAQPGVTRGSLDPDAASLEAFVQDSSASGDLASGERLEALARHGEAFLEPPGVSAARQPHLDLTHLDRDLVHAFLCAYAACFHP